MYTSTETHSNPRAKPQPHAPQSRPWRAEQSLLLPHLAPGGSLRSILSSVGMKESGIRLLVSSEAKGTG
ncbi:hypothetical protein BCR35DRAFT_301738 [Leucosporidium creatinivorum]|uniref:Uncharacterized protein n=1 Tax=Leucosporidium creatinivorum TaxID=106004 RepID=A0A1Y2FW61_9BASI|nr:hypothetical protein BCR35DRAFT_301738 [Leucosporidium creatinivorum]